MAENEMPGEMPHSEGPAPQGDAQGNPMSKMLLGINDALTQLSGGLTDNMGAPVSPEAKDALMSATEDYQKFLGLLGNDLGIALDVPQAEAPEKGVMGNAPADTAGRKGAMPADMAMMKKGAVPA